MDDFEHPTVRRLRGMPKHRYDDAFLPQRARAMTPIVIELPIKTKNPQNGSRGNSMIAEILKRKTYERIRDTSFQIMNGRIRSALPTITWPVSVTIVRLSCGNKMDDDGIAAATKGIRDAVAKSLGVDDGDRTKVRFSYAGRSAPKGAYGVEVRIEGMRTACICEHTMAVHDNLGCTVKECLCLASRSS